jgi:hypothetical protein
LSSTDKCGLSSDAWWDVTAPDGSEALFVGEQSTACRWTPDGGFSPIDLKPLMQGDSLLGVHGFPGGERFMVGGGGALLHWAAGEATPKLQRHSLDLQFVGVSGPTPDSVWAVGQLGVLARWRPGAGDGGAWDEPPLIPAVAPKSPSGLWVQSNEDVWVAGSDGLLKHWNGANWSDVAAEGVTERVDLESVKGTGPQDLILAGKRRLPDGGTESGVVLYYRR